jgi:hypothetical protein
MSGRKEERERLREQRLAAQRAAQSSDQRRLYLGYAVAAIIVAAIIAGVVVVITGETGVDETGVDAEGNAFPELAHIREAAGPVPAGVRPDGRNGTAPPSVETAVLDEAARAARCKLELELPDEGSSHLPEEELDEIEYDTNPPTSGDHSEDPLADGAFADPAPPANYLHSMEHGRVVIHYAPDLPEDEQLEIKGVFEESPAGVILTPNPELRSEVAVTAWLRLATCGNYEGSTTLDLIRAFRDIYRGQGPEAVPLNL